MIPEQLMIVYLLNQYFNDLLKVPDITCVWMTFDHLIMLKDHLPVINFKADHFQIVTML